MDVSNSKQVDSWIEGTIRDHGRFDGAVNLAGILHSDRLLHEESDERYKQIMDINVGGVFYCLRAQLKHIAKDGGSIVSVIIPLKVQVPMTRRSI